jgi:hypothetical protein
MNRKRWRLPHGNPGAPWFLARIAKKRIPVRSTP